MRSGGAEWASPDFESALCGRCTTCRAWRNVSGKRMTLLAEIERWIGGLRSPSGPAWPPRKLSLALQGGGSFGAFTWGVLDRLLEEEKVDFDTVSGASAGAFNAVVLASALVEGD